MTPEQIEKLRDDIKDRQPDYDDGEIDELCNLALKGLARPEARSAVLEEAAQVCDGYTKGQEDVSKDFAMGIEHGAMKCANAIRALKVSEPQEGSS